LQPPHHEPIVGNRVARYRVEAEPVVEWGKLETSLKLTSWGAQRWNRDIGHGTDAWEESDWSVEEWRQAFTHTATVWIMPKLGVYSEYYQPIDRHEKWPGKGQETNYYWLVGIKGWIN
jgi:hypothetical protein